MPHKVNGQTNKYIIKEASIIQVIGCD